MRRSVLKIYFASTACLFESAAGRPKRATHSASLPAQRQLHRNCKTLQQPILWALFPNTAFSTTLLSNTSLQHLCTKLLCNSLLQHASPTLFSGNFLHHSGNVEFKATAPSMSLSSKTLLKMWLQKQTGTL